MKMAYSKNNKIAQGKTNKRETKQIKENYNKERSKAKNCRYCGSEVIASCCKACGQIN